jgi:hypothetical protein
MKFALEIQIIYFQKFSLVHIHIHMYIYIYIYVV